jgi:hypothetical protein
MRKGYIITEKEASDIFLILASARVKLNGKVQTAAINQYKKYAREKLDLLKIENDIPVYKDFYEFIIDVVKPIALDLNTAIAISEQNNDQSSSILVSLNNYKQSVLGIQAKIKNKTLSDWELEKDKLLNEIANIQSIVFKHLEIRDMKDLANI